MKQTAAAPTFSRRSIVGGLSVLGLGSALSLEYSVADGGVGGLPKPNDAAANLHQLLRVQMSTEVGDVPWWYTGRIYAQVGDNAPQLLFLIEGTEIYWPRPVGDGTYSISSRTLTFLRDKDSGQMLREYQNPFTGKRVAVIPNRLGGRDAAIYSQRGLTFTEFGEGEPIPWRIEWHSSGDLVWLTSSRDLPFLPQPWLEAMTMFCPRSQFSDSKFRRTASAFTSTYLSPWLSWMDMQDRPGHLVWHSSGRKLNSIDEVPHEYRQRADDEYQGLLTANPESYG